ncbi:MAG: hypothetical protein ACW981_21180 [Candidatus Hodarchaeales archaeon]|jgi:hypothetical protein
MYRRDSSPNSISHKEILKYAKTCQIEFKIPYFDTIAETGLNIDQTIEKLADIIITSK